MQTTADYCISLHITSQTIPNILLNIEVTISMRHHVLFKCLLTWLLTQHNRPSLSNEPKSKLSFNEKNCWFLTPITVVCTLLLLSNYWGFWYILSFMFFFQLVTSNEYLLQQIGSRPGALGYLIHHFSTFGYITTKTST